jgi:hypothetical protein
MITPLIDAAALRSAVAPEVYMNVFDDLDCKDPDQVDQSPVVQDVLDDANAWVISGLPAIYGTIPDGTDGTISVLLKSAIHMYLRYFTFIRRPEFTRALGRDWEGMLKTGDTIMDRIRAGLLQIAPKDAPPEPSPRNLGGMSVDGGQRVFCDSPDGTRNSGDF